MISRGIDKLVSVFAPGAAVKRAHNRRVLAYYEAATPGTSRKGRKETGSPDVAVMRAGMSLTQQARHLEQNHDLARGVLNTLVGYVIGQNGIGVEPMPRDLDGNIDYDFAGKILDLYQDWCERPEVTWAHDFASAQRIAGRAWLRDGEVFAQIVEGLSPTIDHGTEVPLSLELLESDYVPFDLNDTGNNIIQGIQRNAWGRPRNYYAYRGHPGDSYFSFSGAQNLQNLKTIPAERMLHVKMIDRIRQTRGVSLFASVLSRLENIKDYEESEQVAAKVAASMAAYIKKGAPDFYTVNTELDERKLKFKAGMIFDDLLPGEEIGTIDTNRPNPNVKNHRQGQLRAVSAGTNTGYSSIAREFEGSYSSQRQELNDATIGYRILSAEFTTGFVRPTFKRVVALAVLSGKLQVPKHIARNTIDRALYVPPYIPWIDPVKEAVANKTMERSGHESAQAIIRARGRNPIEVLRQIADWRKMAAKLGIVLDSDPAATANAGTAQDYLRQQVELDAAQLGANE